MTAKPPIWYVNAAARTLRAALPGLVRPDDDWAAGFLRAGELELFLRLPPTERCHGVAVAREVLRADPGASASLLRAALLHDVGKLGTPQFVLYRVLTHLLGPASYPAEPRLRGLAGARQARVHHPAYGADLLRLAGSGDDVVALVRGHHSAAGGADAAALRSADERH